MWITFIVYRKYNVSRYHRKTMCDTFCSIVRHQEENSYSNYDDSYEYGYAMIWCDDTAEQVILYEWECMCWMRLTWLGIICECGGGGGWGCWGDGCDEGCVGGDGRIVELFCNKQRKRQTCSNTAIQATARLEGFWGWLC